MMMHQWSSRQHTQVHQQACIGDARHTVAERDHVRSEGRGGRGMQHAMQCPHTDTRAMPETCPRHASGMRFILGLSFEKGDKDLAKRQMDAALANLPPAAIVTFEIGNEVSRLIGCL